jgi:hypothetical protein
MNRGDVQNRLVASGLNSGEVATELALYDALSPTDQALYQDWMEEVSNPDIATRVRSGNPARTPPIYVHDVEGNPIPLNPVIVGKAFVVSYDAATRPAGTSVVLWITAAQPASPQADDQWLVPSTSALQRWSGAAWVVFNKTSFVAGQGHVYQQTTDPTTTVPAGTEFVWFQTDGAGALLDILSGVGSA